MTKMENEDQDFSWASESELVIEDSSSISKQHNNKRYSSHLHMYYTTSLSKEWKLPSNGGDSCVQPDLEVSSAESSSNE